MERLEVKPRRLQTVLLVLLGLWFVPVGLGIAGAGLYPFEPVRVLLGSLMLAAFGYLVWAGRRAQTRSAIYFSNEGVLRSDGRHLAWSDLQRVVTQIHNDAIWRIEIHFANDESVWVLPLRVVNFVEVRDFIRRLPGEHTEVDV